MAVWDGGPGLPDPGPPPNLSLETLDLSPERWDDNGGWGLTIITTLAADHGDVEDPGGGKWIWARLKS